MSRPKRTLRAPKTYRDFLVGQEFVASVQMMHESRRKEVGAQATGEHPLLHSAPGPLDEVDSARDDDVVVVQDSPEYTVSDDDHEPVPVHQPVPVPVHQPVPVPVHQPVAALRPAAAKKQTTTAIHTPSATWSSDHLLHATPPMDRISTKSTSTSTSTSTASFSTTHSSSPFTSAHETKGHAAVPSAPAASQAKNNNKEKDQKSKKRSAPTFAQGLERQQKQNEQERERERQRRKQEKKAAILQRLGITDISVFQSPLHVLQHQMLCMEVASDATHAVRYTSSGWDEQHRITLALHTLASQRYTVPLCSEEWRTQGILLGAVAAYQSRRGRSPGPAFTAVVMRAAAWYPVVNSRSLRECVSALDTNHRMVFPTYDAPALLLTPVDYASWYKNNVECHCRAMQREACVCFRVYMWDVAISFALRDLFAAGTKSK